MNWLRYLPGVAMVQADATGGRRVSSSRSAAYWCSNYRRTAITSSSSSAELSVGQTKSFVGTNTNTVLKGESMRRGVAHQVHLLRTPTLGFYQRFLKWNQMQLQFVKHNFRFHITDTVEKTSPASLAFGEVHERAHFTSFFGVVNISYLCRRFRRHFNTNLYRECDVIESRMFSVDGFTCVDLKALIIDPWAYTRLNNVCWESGMDIKGFR